MRGQLEYTVTQNSICFPKQTIVKKIGTDQSIQRRQTTDVIHCAIQKNITLINL